MISVDLVDLEDVMQTWRLWSSGRWEEPFRRNLLVSDLGESRDSHLIVRPTAFEDGIRELAFAPGVVRQVSRLSVLRSLNATFWTWLETYRFQGNLRWPESAPSERATPALLVEMEGRRVDESLFLRPLLELLTRASHDVAATIRIGTQTDRPTGQHGAHRTLSVESAHTRSQLLREAGIPPAAERQAERQYSLVVSAPRLWPSTREATLDALENLALPDESIATFQVALDLVQLE